MKNKLSQNAEYLLTYCWEKSDPRVIVLTLDHIYEIKDKKYKIDQQLINEFKSCDRVKVWDGGKNSYNIMGLKGRHKE